VEHLISVALRDASVAFIHDEEIRPVLRRIDLEIGSGQLVALLGRNGSGKSTLLRVFAGLLPLSRGSIERVEDSPIPIVFQNPDAQIVGETVLEDICFGLENIAIPTEQMAERASKALAAVGLAGFEDRPIISLSGGQKQLVCIASAIAMNPPVIIMDEPTAMLDPISKRQVMAIAEQLQREGKTVIWATHSMDEVGLADRVIVLASGSLVFDGSPEQFFYGVDDLIDEAEDVGELGPEAVATAARKSSDARLTSPCRRLGFHPPYAVEAVQSLHARGMMLDRQPVRVEDCLEAVDQLCR